MSIVRAVAVSIIFSVGFTADASAACDEFASKIIEKKLAPAIADLDCTLVKEGGLDKKGHQLKKVCYESSGVTSKIHIETYLRCYSSSESFVSKIGGEKTQPSISENADADAEVRGADCKLLNVKVSPSGEISKVLVKWFDVDGKARKALEGGLAEICGK